MRLSFFVLSFLLCLRAFAVETPEVVQFRNRVLYLRVHQLLEQRYLALEDCASRTGSPEISTAAEGVGLGLIPLASPTEEQVIELLRVYQQTEHLRPACNREIGAFDQALHSLERKEFARAMKLQFVKQLDPHCFLRVEKNTRGVVDSNPCFAAVGMINSVLWEESRSGEMAYSIDRFLGRLHQEIEQAGETASIDLWSIFLNNDLSSEDFFEYRRAFLAALGMLTMGASSNAGVTDGFGDFAWQSALARKKSPLEAFEAYTTLKKRRDLFRDLWAWARLKKVRIVINGTVDVTDTNRHDFIAAFLSCHYGETNGKLAAKALVNALGYAYESYDLKSHLEDGIDFKRSLKNFGRDTMRYSDGAEWGYAFCQTFY
ncbi:MAG: hypothetical protein AB1540_03720 [Bdellovibrionota bacterium]